MSQEKPVTLEEALERIKKLERALKFYADGEHFIFLESTSFDTVSGEPQNFYENEEGDIVEDGTLAKMVLEGADIDFDADHGI